MTDKPVSDKTRQAERDAEQKICADLGPVSDGWLRAFWRVAGRVK